MDASVEAAPHPVRLRGRSYLAFVFTPVVPIVDWLKELDATIARSPGFFVGKPVVLDLSALELSRPAITHLLLSLEKKNIRILGIEGVDASLLTSTMPPLLSGGRTCAIAQVEPEKAEVKPPAAPSMSTGRCGAAPWRASTAMRRRGSFASGSRPSCSPSTATTRQRRNWTPACAIGPRRPGLTAGPCGSRRLLEQTVKEVRKCPKCSW